MIDHLSDKARADVLRAEVAQLMPGDPTRNYLQDRIDKLDPPRPVMPENPQNGDVIDAVFSTDPAHPEYGTTVRLFYICGVWMNKHGVKHLNWPAVVHYEKVL